MGRKKRIMEYRRRTKKITRLVLTVCMVVVACFLCRMKTEAASIVSTDHQKYSYKEYRNDLNQLAKKYPTKMQLNVIGESADKRKLYEVVLGNPNAKKHLLVIGNLHAREYMTTQLCMAQIERYLKMYNKKIAGDKVSNVLDEVAIHYVPSCNPDGTAISQYGFGAIRNKKLRAALRRMPGSSRRWKANARGVDLNRNWDIYFRPSGRKGASGYRGKRPASEPEIKALVKWVNQVETRGKIVGVVSYHSTGSIIYGKCAKEIRSDVKKQTARMTSVAKKLTGYRLMPTESVRYAAGCSREYFLYKRNIPFITIEVGYGACPLGAREFKSIWKKNKDMVMRQAMLFD